MAKVNAYYKDNGEYAFGGDVFDRGLSYYSSASSATDLNTAAIAKCTSAVDGLATSCNNFYEAVGCYGDKGDCSASFAVDTYAVKSEVYTIQDRLQALESKIDAFENKYKRRESSLRASLKTLSYAREIN